MCFGVKVTDNGRASHTFCPIFHYKLNNPFISFVCRYVCWYVYLDVYVCTLCICVRVCVSMYVYKNGQRINEFIRAATNDSFLDYSISYLVCKNKIVFSYRNI